MTQSPQKSTHVPGQYLGYSLQTTRCLARLLDADSGALVSIEVFEDIGVETPDGCRTAEQNKSISDDGNPVSDRATDLWKTFSNWIDAAKSKELDPERTLFEIYVSQPKSGTIVNSFSNAKDYNTALHSLQMARTELWGAAPDYVKRLTVASSIAGYVTNVFEANETLVCKIIQAFSLCTGSGSPHKDLEDRMRKNLTPTDILEDTLRYALGWVKKETDKLLEQNKPAVLSVDSFRCAVTEYIRRHDRRTILSSYAGSPDPEDVKDHLTCRTYVRQLELIEGDPNDLESAVIDFLKAAVDRTYWSVKGWVDDETLSEYEEGLLRVWKNVKLKAHATLKHLDGSAQGQSIYAECSSHTAKLGGLDVPSHFTPGSLHALADKPVIV